MRALTIRGPWLGAICAGRPIEIRTQPPPAALHRQRIALHCAAAWRPADDAAAAALAAHDVDVEPARSWRRRVVATARLGGWMHVEVTGGDAEWVHHRVLERCPRLPASSAPRKDEWAAPRRWAWDGLPDRLRERHYIWRLGEVRQLEPVGPVRGQLGFWGLPDDVANALPDAGRRWRIARALELLDPLTWRFGEPRRSGWRLSWARGAIVLRVDMMWAEVRARGLHRVDDEAIDRLCLHLIEAVEHAFDADEHTAAVRQMLEAA